MTTPAREPLPVRLLEGQGASERAVRALAAYYAELDERLGGGFRPELEGLSPADVTPPHGDFLLVSELGTSAVLGCGGVRLREGGDSGSEVAVAELHGMWLVPDVRGQGLGRFLLRSLENRARALGARRVVLSLDRSLSEALALYTSAGYVPIGAYEDSPFADTFLGKDL